MYRNKMKRQKKNVKKRLKKTVKQKWKQVPAKKKSPKLNN
jgi:hypothetical protein